MAQHEARPDRAQRAAAVASMLLLVLALVAAGFGLLSGGIWRLAGAVVALGVAIVGAWYALSRRGLGRAVGAAAAGAGLGAFIALTVTAQFRGLALALALAAAVLSAAAGRYALGPARTGPPAAPEIILTEARPAVLILNLRSGGGKAERFHLADECRSRGIRPVVLGPGDDLEKLALEAVDGGAAVIGMAGGDGSQALVASVAAARGLPYVCVPAGTRNHLALDLGIDRDDVVGALDAFSDRVERVIDLADVNGRIFVNNASMGLYARIVSSPEYRDAKLKTASAFLPDMLGPDAEPSDLCFTGPDGSEWPYAHMLLVSNNPYELEHLIGSGRRPRMDSGLLGIAAARIDGPADAVGFIALEAAGRVRSFHGWVEWTARRFRVDSGARIEIGVDGEASAMDPPLTFTSRAGGLRVRLPASARFPAPGSDAGSSPHLASLLRVAAGHG